MAGEWRASTWGDEISLEYGKALRGYDTDHGGYQVFGSNGPIGWTSSPLAPGPGVILGRKGAYRGVQFSRDPFFVIDTAYYVVPKSALDMRWLYYAIQHYRLGEIDDGSPIPSTTRSAVYVVRLDVPPLDEQRAIAQALGALDDKIESNRRMSETLEQIARTLFKAWFVDRTDSPPDVVPGEWLDVPLSTIAEVHRDKWDPGAEPDVSVQHFSLPAYDAGRWPIHEPGRAIKSTKALVPAGSVLLSRLNPRIRRVWLTDVAPDVPAVASTEFLVLTPKPPFGRAFVYLAVSADDFQGTLVSRATGTSGSHQRVRPASVLDVPVPGPPEHLLAAFEPVAGGLLDRLQICARESQTLAALRDALLPKLISGDLRIPDAERIVSEVT